MSARGEYSALEQGETNNVVAPKSYRNRIVSVVSVALVMTGGAFLVANSRGSVTSTSVTNLAAKESSAPQQAKLPMKVDMDRVEIVKGVSEKKEDAPKEDKKEIDGGKPVSKKTAKPTVKPTTPPKPTVPPTTKKPSEKKDVKSEESVRTDGPKGMTKKSEANADKGLAPPARQLVGLSSMPPKKSESPKEEKKEEAPRGEEVDGGKPVSKKTAKPTVKPISAPKPTVPPKTGKPAEKHANLATEDKHASSDSRLDGPKGMDHKSENNAKAGMAPPARSLSSQEFGGPKKSSTPVATSMKASVLDLFGGKSGKTKKPTFAPSFEPLGGKPTPIPWTGKPAEAPTGKHAIEEESAPKASKEATLEREEGPKGMSKTTVKKENGGFTPPRQLENRKEAPAPKEAPAAKKETMSPPKKADAPKEEKKEVAPKEEKKGDAPKEEKEVDGGKPVSKKTAKPTVKPTTPPKPTVPPTTKKPSEKKGEEVRVDGPKLHPSRMLSEVRGKVTPSSSSTRGKGKTEKPVEGPPAPQPRGPRELAAVPVVKDDADPCHDGLSPRCTPPTSKPAEHRRLTVKTASSVSQAAKNAIYGLSGPTKSPSTGLHKPTWKPTAGKPTGKPLEQGASKTIASKSDATSEVVAEEQAKNETPVDTTTKAASKSASAPSSSNKKVLMHDGAPARQLTETESVPTKSPSSGLHKPTWKPSSKPVEHAEEDTTSAKTEDVVVVEDTTTTTTTTAAETTTKASNTNRESGPKGATKKLAHDGAPTTRKLGQAHPGDMTTSIAGKGAFAEVGPSKSPSTGIHKPTWKPTQGTPTGKPVEPWKEGVESAHTEVKKSAHVEGELEKTHSSRGLAAVKDEKADPCHDGLSPRCTPPTSKPVEHRSLAGSPTKSPSSGLHKPTWKPSSKPAEHRVLQKDEKADPCHDGLSPRCTPPTSKPVEHRSLAGSPTKSPSSGLHKPTWKPSSKPAEH